MDLVMMKNQQAVTTSMNLAESFAKNHKNVIQTIESKIQSAENSAHYKKMFAEGDYKDSRGRIQRMYYMNRDGFSFIAFGFTGKKADEFKLKYIEAFNEMENHIKEQQQFNVPTSLPEALRLAAEIEEERQALEHKVEELQPKADYYDRIMRNPGLITVSMIAKNYGMATVMFNRKLHELGIQFKQGKTWLLYKKYQNEGYTHVETYEYTTTDGLDKSRPTMKWTQKGHKFLYDVLKENGVLPLIEQNKQLEVS